MRIRIEIIDTMIDMKMDVPVTYKELLILLIID